MAVKTYIVTVPGGTGGGYYIDGVQKPVIPVVTGGTFRFNQDAATNNNHPLILSTTTSTAGIISTGVTYYLDGPSNQSDYTNTSLFNAASVRYIEITVAETSDFYYLCYVHGSSMGNTMDVTLDTWSALNWGAGQWSDQDNINLTILGTQLTSNLGNETIVAEINSGWGRNNWDDLAWGVNYGNAIAILNGIQLSTNIGSVSISGQLNTGWGSDTWGTETWGISGLDIQLTGIGLSVSLSSVTTQSDVDDFTVTGQQATIVVGTGTEASSQLVQQVTGLPMGMTLQFEEVVINVVGFGLTMQEGEEVADANTIATVSAESPVTWGNSAWGYGVYGNQPVTTLAMSMQEGNTDPAPDVSLTGNAAAMFVGDETVTGDANTGTITNINWGEETWGQSTWGNGNYFDATGYAQAATINLGTVVGDANTIASITGQLMTMQEGDEGITANARINVTGINLTFSVGTVYNLIWNEVNTGTTSVWTEVDTAA
jgi:hypothetical protein